MLESLADRALRSEFEPVLCLEAPEAVEVPRSLLRADGRSIYQRNGGSAVRHRRSWPWKSGYSRKLEPMAHRA